MKSCNRRLFMIQIAQIAAAGCAIAASPFVLAEDQKPKGKLTPDDPYAKSMGFRLDTNEVDQAKYTKHTVDQNCSKCQLYKGAEGDPEGPCSFFGNRIVPVTGWCRNFKARTS